ncbi:hypothetical protein MLD52_16570 [Puniceicoccaceae bacterium K14]|nr:hypothetical protein [Puniceicoccaceae bacterium K14]
MSVGVRVLDDVARGSLSPIKSRWGVEIDRGHKASNCSILSRLIVAFFEYGDAVLNDCCEEEVSRECAASLLGSKGVSSKEGDPCFALWASAFAKSYG